MTTRKRLFMGLLVAMLPWISVQNLYALEEVVKEEKVENVVKKTDIVPVVDNVIIYFDTSGSMKGDYHDTGMSKLLAGKKLIRQRGETMPVSDLNVGLYSFAGGVEDVYPVQPFNKDDFLKAVDTLPEESSGATMLDIAVRHLSGILKGLSGRTVVFLFTDGTYTKLPIAGTADPIAAAGKISKQYDVSFQIVSTTDDKKQQKLLNAVGSINESSRVIPLESLLNHPEYYTGTVFVINESYIIVEGTRQKIVGFALDDTLFDFDKAEIKNDFTKELDDVGQLMEKNPDSYITLAGFTDSIGREEYNRELSRERVEAVETYLVDKFKINSDRIVLNWYGSAAPIADNSTEEGRSKNRRVLGFVGGIE